jgi:hypothetical protein
MGRVSTNQFDEVFEALMKWFAVAAEASVPWKIAFQSNKTQRAMEE